MEKKNKTTKILMHDIPLRLIKVLNIICLTIPFAGCWYGYYSGQMKDGFYNRGNLLMIALFMLVYFLFARIYNAFLISVNRISEMVYSQVLAALITDGISYLIIALLVKGFPNIIPGVMAIAGQIVMSLIWCFLAHRWYFRSFPPQKTMIVYDVREGMEKLIDQYDLECKFEVTEIIQVTDVINHLEKLNTIETVFLSGIHSHERNIILKYCIEHRIQVYVIPRVGDVLMSGAQKVHMFHLPMLRTGRYNPQPEYLILKRLADLVIAGTATVILSPIMIITAIAIKAYDRGPVFYSQIRLTQDGKEFGVLKFRSMKVNAEKDGVARLSSGENDPRITPVGRIIRKCRIDELPQLLNILKGDMTIVGPTGYGWMDESGNDLHTVLVPPKKTDYKKMIRLSNPIGNLSVMYDQEALGKFEVPPIKKRNDFALWLKILKKTDYCYGMEEVLGTYRMGRAGSVSSNKLKQAKYHWQLYHEIEGHSVLRSLYEVGCWAWVKGTGIGIDKRKA